MKLPDKPKQPAAFDVARRELCLERRAGLIGTPALHGRVACEARQDDQARRAGRQCPAISLQRLSDDVPSRVRGRGYWMPGEKPPEIAGQIRRRRVPPIALLRQCAADDRLEISVQRRVELTQPGRLVGDDAARKFGKRRRVVAEGSVWSGVGTEGLRAHRHRAVSTPPGRASTCSGLIKEESRQPSGIKGTVERSRRPPMVGGDTEVQQLGLAVWCNQNVGRLQVAVEDATLVGVLHRITHERRKLDAFVRCQLPCVSVIRDRRADDQLHRDEGRRGVIAGMGGIDMGDSGVLELSQRSRLDLEAPADRGGVESAPQDLHCDRAGRMLLARKVHDTPTHPSR